MIAREPKRTGGAKTHLEVREETPSVGRSISPPRKIENARRTI